MESGSVGKDKEEEKKAVVDEEQKTRGPGRRKRR